MQQANYLDGMLEFIKNSPTPYHASANICSMLNEAGYSQISESELDAANQHENFYVVRNQSTVIAVARGGQGRAKGAIRLVGSHIDSPCLKLNPNAAMSIEGYRSLNVEVYGSALLRTWFDRDLSIAGRVYRRTSGGRIESSLIDWGLAVAVIPSIAIHLERDANKRQEIDSQVHINPMVTCAYSSSSAFKLESMIQKQLSKQNIEVDEADILGFDLRLYDTNAPAFLGANKEFVSSARIDNLLSCYAGVQALIECDSNHHCVLVCSDHEEVGSMSDVGAHSPFLRDILHACKIFSLGQAENSIHLSADGAHGLHPNYLGKHDPQHRPILNEGPVIKLNANQRYATSDETESFVRNLCIESEIPYQFFVSKNDMPCGTTIGPIVSAELGIKTVDVGVAQFAMHSIRELAGSQDAVDFKRLLTAFFQTP